LDSIVNQTYTNLEIIVVNDGSKDNSLEIINDYVKKDPRIVVIDQENQGQSVARNKALVKAKGRYTIFLDSDDYIEEMAIFILVKQIQKLNAEMIIFGHREIYEDSTLDSANIFLGYDENKCHQSFEIAEEVLRCNFLGTVWNKLFSTNFIKENQLFFEPGRYVQDWFPMFAMILAAKTIGFVNQPLYNYRIHQAATTSKKTQKNIDDYVYAANNIIELAEKKQLAGEAILVFKTQVFKTVVNRYYEIYKFKMYIKIAENPIVWFSELIERQGKEFEIMLYRWRVYPFYKSAITMLRIFKNR
ncbi:MAG: glycosyltransferase, partial [Culicoidibacterales bacterium]